MKKGPGIAAALLIGVAWLALRSTALGASNHGEMSLEPVGQSIAGSALPAELVGASAAAVPMQNNLAPANPASKLCADGTRAID